MNCERLHEAIDRYVDGSLGADERAAIEAHLSTCDECRCVVEVMTSGADPAIVQPVLARTTGKSCGRVQEELSAGTDVSATVRAHVDECESCERFVAVLARCDRVLPELASVTADADFASDVVMATLERPKLSHVAWRRWLDRVERWLERPRAAQEFAYAVTVIAVLLTSTPVSPFPEVPGWFATITRSPFASGYDSAQMTGRTDATDRLLDEIGVRGGRLFRDLDRVGQGIATTGAGFLTGDPDQVHRGADQVGCGLQSLWIGVQEPEAEMEGPCADPATTGSGTRPAREDFAMMFIAAGGRT